MYSTVSTNPGEYDQSLHYDEVQYMMSGRMLTGARVVQGARVDPFLMYPGTSQYSRPQ